MIKGITFSAFDLCHPGHLKMLEDAKTRCDYLIVGLHVNPQEERKTKNKPVETAFERYLRLKACKWVDEIIPYQTEQDVVNMLHTLDVDVRFIGEEYRGKDFTGKGIIPEYYNRRKHSYSSSGLRKRL